MHERAEDVGAVGRHACTPPACARRDRACRAASRRSSSAPAEDPRHRPRRRRSRSTAESCRSSRVGEPPLVLELALARLRLPRRHDAPRRDVGDLRRVPPHIVVGEQAERADLAGPMARRAARPDDRRDVFVEGQARLRRRDGRADGDQQSKRKSQRAHDRGDLCVSVDSRTLCPP